MNTIILSLLQSASMMLAAANGANVSDVLAQKAITAGEQAVQIAVQAQAQIPFDVPKNQSNWPNYDGIMNAAYSDLNGNWTKLGNNVLLIGDRISFGDLNDDGLDDAAVIVNKPNARGNHYFLEAMLNQGGIMFNIAELPLKNAAVKSHRIVYKMIDFDGVKYKLFGNKLLKI